MKDLRPGKSVLLVTFAFPPIGGSAVQRVLKFAKYLPEFGWRPVILTVDSAVFPVYNHAGLEEIGKDLKVYRTKFFDFLKVKKKIINHKNASETAAAVLNKAEKVNSSLKFLMKFFNQYFLIPDDKIGWIPFAVKEGLKIIKKENIDVIYTTGDPFSVFLIGYLLKKIAGKKWVVDYRDSWTDFLIIGFAKGLYRRKIEQFLEYRVLKNADKIISVSASINEKLIKKYPGIGRNKYEVLTNGYDPDDFKDIKKEKRKDNKFVIIHAGVLIKARSPELFLKALSGFLIENSRLEKDIEVKFIGASYDEDMNEMIKKYNLKNNVKFLGYMEHKKCVEEVVNADALLLIQNYNNLEAFGGKLFEYLYAGNPILGIVPPEGCAGRLIEETKSGVVVKENTVEKIKKAIKELYFNVEINSDREKIKQYDRCRIAQKLAAILDKGY